MSSSNRAFLEIVILLLLLPLPRTDMLTDYAHDVVEFGIPVLYPTFFATCSLDILLIASRLASSATCAA